MLKEVELGDTKIYLLGVVKGLLRDRETVRAEYTRIKPESVSISISKEELEGLKHFIVGEELDLTLTNYEEIYARQLKNYGKIEMPPPCYQEALRLCHENKTPIIPIDLNEEEFTDAYCAYITGYQLFRHSIRASLLKRKKFKAKTAEEFVLEWDAAVNNLAGFKKLEHKREEYMSENLQNLAKRYKKILAIIELERMQGVIAHLTQSTHRTK